MISLKKQHFGIYLCNLFIILLCLSEKCVGLAIRDNNGVFLSKPDDYYSPPEINSREVPTITSYEEFEKIKINTNVRIPEIGKTDSIVTRDGNLFKRVIRQVNSNYPPMHQQPPPFQPSYPGSNPNQQPYLSQGPHHTNLQGNNGYPDASSQNSQKYPEPNLNENFNPYYNPSQRPQLSYPPRAHNNSSPAYNPVKNGRPSFNPYQNQYNPKYPPAYPSFNFNNSRPGNDFNYNRPQQGYPGFNNNNSNLSHSSQYNQRPYNYNNSRPAFPPPQDNINYGRPMQSYPGFDHNRVNNGQNSNLNYSSQYNQTPYYNNGRPEYPAPQDDVNYGRPMQSYPGYNSGLNSNLNDSSQYKKRPQNHDDFNHGRPQPGFANNNLTQNGLPNHPTQNRTLDLNSPQNYPSDLRGELSGTNQGVNKHNTNPQYTQTQSGLENFNHNEGSQYSHYDGNSYNAKLAPFPPQSDVNNRNRDNTFGHNKPNQNVYDPKNDHPERYSY